MIKKFAYVRIEFLKQSPFWN